MLFNKSNCVQLGVNYHNLDHDSYAVLPFVDIRTNKQRTSGCDAERVMTDSFETALMNTGSKIVERNKIQHVLKQMQFEYQGNVDEEQLQEIGKLTNSKAIVLGMIRDFKNAEFNDKEKPDKATKCTTISFSVKAINIKTGEILWKGALTKSTGFKDDFFCKCNYNVIQYADKVSNDMVEKIMKMAKKTQKKSSI
jgi:hypothetical protein